MSWFSDTFLGGAEKKAKQRADEQAAANRALIQNTARPFQSLTEIPVGKSLNDTILAALNKGEGIGFSPDFVSKTTNPAIASRETRFNQYEMPALSSEMGSRGLSRSTIAGNAIGRETTAKEQDINQLIANAYLAQEQQKKLDQARYEGLGMNWTGAEADQNRAYVSNDLSRTNALMGVNNQFYDTMGGIADKSGQNLNQLIGTAVNLASLAAAPATGGTSLMAAQALQKINEAEKASPYTKKLSFSSIGSPYGWGA